LAAEALASASLTSCFLGPPEREVLARVFFD